MMTAPNTFRGSEYDEYDCSLCAGPLRFRLDELVGLVDTQVDHVIMFRRSLDNDHYPIAVCLGCLEEAPSIALKRVMS